MSYPARAEGLGKYGKQKQVKKMQWLQKAEITIIYSQDIMLDDNAICLPSSTHYSPITFQSEQSMLYRPYSITGWLSHLGLQNTPTLSLQRSKTPPTGVLDMILNNLMNKNIFNILYGIVFMYTFLLIYDSF